MQWIPKTNQQVVIRLCIIACLAGLGLPWLLPQPTVDSTIFEEDTHWSLPTPMQSNQAQQAYQTVQQEKPWHRTIYSISEPKVPEQTAIKARQWQFVGTIQQGEQLYMLVLEDKQQTLSRRYKTGDMLPDDALIMAIAPDHVLVKKADSEEKVSLYPIKQK